MHPQEQQSLEQTFDDRDPWEELYQSQRKTSEDIKTVMKKNKGA
jgi:hypothetical protein